jgi:hypothetical protein
MRNEEGRPTTGAPSTSTVSQTSYQGTGPDTIRRGVLPDAWHEQAEFENAVSYDAGYRDGFAAAEQAIGEEIARAVGVPVADRRDVIRWLIRTTGQPEPYSTPENGTTLGVVERDVLGRWAA